MSRFASRKNGLPITKVQLSERCRQWWQARRDARRGLPALPSHDGDAFPRVEVPVEVVTPHLHRLFQERDEILESARNRVIVATTDARAKIAQLQRHISNLQEEIGRQQDIVTAAQPDESELARVGAGETKLPADALRARRQAEAERRVVPAKSQIARCQREIDDTREQIALIEAPVVAQVRDSQALAERVCSYTDARVSRYWRTLTRRHPQGRQLADLHRPARRDIGWITASDHWSVLNNKKEAS